VEQVAQTLWTPVKLDQVEAAGLPALRQDPCPNRLATFKRGSGRKLAQSWG
jgi:hypothetical protein